MVRAIASSKGRSVWRSWSLNAPAPASGNRLRRYLILWGFGCIRPVATQEPPAGRSNREIADALYISVKTASVHVSNILRKLGVTSRVQAAAIVHRSGHRAS